MNTAEIIGNGVFIIGAISVVALGYYIGAASDYAYTAPKIQYISGTMIPPLQALNYGDCVPISIIHNDLHMIIGEVTYHASGASTNCGVKTINPFGGRNFVLSMGGHDVNINVTGDTLTATSHRGTCKIGFRRGVPVY